MSGPGGWRKGMARGAMQMIGAGDDASGISRRDGGSADGLNCQPRERCTVPPVFPFLFCPFHWVVSACFSRVSAMASGSMAAMGVHPRPFGFETVVCEPLFSLLT